jgi:transcriptional regulator with XRE-family HTH domain
MTKPKMTVAQYLTIKINESGKTQKEIATEIGYDAANVITMFKQGLTKLPLNTVGPIARALNVDPAFLLRLVFREYLPETFDAVEHALGTTIVTENERKLLDQFRQSTDNSDPEMLIFGPTRALVVVLADR